MAVAAAAWQERGVGSSLGSSSTAVAAERQWQPAWWQRQQLGGSATAVLPPHFPTRCHCRQSCCCHRTSHRAATAAKVALLSSCRLCRQAGRRRHHCCQAGCRHRHRAANAVLPLRTPLPRCRRCHHHPALAKLPPPPSSWPLPSRCHHASATSVNFVSIIIAVAAIVACRYRGAAHCCRRHHHAASKLLLPPLPL